MKRKSTTATFDGDTPITQADIDAGRLILRKRTAGRAVQTKKRVTLYLDAGLVEFFKAKAGQRGYQTLINEALKAHIGLAGKEDAPLTVRKLRQVLREELHAG